MNKKFLKLLISICLSAAPFLVQSILAAPALDIPREHIQPDGSVIEVYTYGDEHYSFVGDADGYMLRLNDNGAYEYVTKNTAVQYSAALDSARPANAVKGFDLKPEKTDHAEMLNIGPAPKSVSLRSAYSQAVSDDANTAKKTKILVVGVDFTDVQLSDEFHSTDKLYDIFFANGENDISVNSYYDEVSGGRLIFEPAFELGVDYEIPADGYGMVGDGIIKVKLNYEHPDTVIDGNVDDDAVDGIVSDVMAVVDGIVDFSEYNTDGADENGLVYISNDELIISFVVAGYEASAGNDDNSVWAHQKGLYAFNQAGFYASDDVCTVNGEECIVYLWSECRNIEGSIYVSPSAYAMMGAMFDSSTPMGIGSFCHELGHVLGLPDLYNTLGGSDYADISTLSLMNSGSWCRKQNATPGSLPAHIDPWGKIYLGWYDADELIEIDYDDQITLEVLSTLSEQAGYKYIKVNTKDSDEYYLIENRGFEGFNEGLQYYYEGNKGYDKAINTSGIVIWHIDDGVIYGDSGYVTNIGTVVTNLEQNTVNVTETPGISVVRSGKGDATFEDDGKPLWRAGVNSMPLFGKLSTPESNLNTYTDDADSGVEMRFLSPPGEKMSVELGGVDAVTAIVSDDNTTSIYAFNNTELPANFIPIIQTYGISSAKDIIKIPPFTVDADNIGISTIDVSIMDDTKYKMFTFGMQNDLNINGMGFIPTKLNAENECDNIQVIGRSPDNSIAIFEYDITVATETYSYFTFTKPVEKVFIWDWVNLKPLSEVADIAYTK